MKTWEEYRTSLIKHGKECVLQNRLLVETRQKELEAWMQKAFAQFAHTISDKNFPCPFRQKSWAKGSTLFLFIKEPNDFSNLLRGMIEYTNFTKSTPIDNRILCPLVVFFFATQDNLQDPKDIPTHGMHWNGFTFTTPKNGLMRFLTTQIIQHGVFALMVFSFL